MKLQQVHLGKFPGKMWFSKANRAYEEHVLEIAKTYTTICLIKLEKFSLTI